MYGLGYGLGKMFEGATGGMAQGMAEKIQIQDQRDQQQKDNDYRDIMMKTQKSASALNTAWSIAQHSATPEETFKSVYGSLFPDEEMPDIKFNSKAGNVSFSWNGLQIEGMQKPVMDAVNIISQKPEVTQDVLKQLMQLGLAKVTMDKKEDKTHTVSPGQQIIDASGKVIYSAPKEPKDPKTFTLSEGQAVYDATGKIIAQAPKADTDKVPDRVKEARSIVLSLARQMGAQPDMIRMMAPGRVLDKDAMAQINALFGSKEMDQQTKDLYDQAIQILNEYYGIPDQNAGAGSMINPEAVNQLKNVISGRPDPLFDAFPDASAAVSPAPGTVTRRVYDHRSGRIGYKK